MCVCVCVCVCVFTVRIVGIKGKDVYNILTGHGVRRNWKPFSVMLLFSCSVVPHCSCHRGLKHARPPCPSLSPGVFSNLCPLSWWCHPTISSSIAPFSSCHQSFPASESFPMSQIFNSGGKSFGTSASASVLPINIQGWLPLELTGWSPCCPSDSQEFSPAPQFQSISSSVLSLHYGSTHICTWLLEKPQLSLYGPLMAKRYLCF